MCLEEVYVAWTKCACVWEVWLEDVLSVSEYFLPLSFSPSLSLVLCPSSLYIYSSLVSGPSQKGEKARARETVSVSAKLGK